MDAPAMNAVTQRLDRLERESRWWKRLTGLMVVATLGACTLGAVKPPGEVRATRVVLVDPEGRSRVTLGANTYGTVREPYGLTLLDAEGKVRGEFYGGSAGGGGLQFFDGSVRPLAFLVAHDRLPGVLAAESSLVLFGAERQTVRLSAGGGGPDDPDGAHASISVTAEQAEGFITASPKTVKLAFWSLVPRATAAVNSEHGMAELTLRDGAPSLSLADKLIGYPGVLLGHAGLVKERTGIKEQRPASSLVMFDKAGNVLWKAP